MSTEVRGTVVQTFGDNLLVEVLGASQLILIELPRAMLFQEHSLCTAVALYSRTDVSADVKGAARNWLVFSALYVE